MANLLTTQTLARWTQSDEAEVAADVFAVDLIEKLSALVCFLGGHPDWTLASGEDQAPVDVQMVMLQVAKRSYENPQEILQEGSVGPLGGERYADQHALFMDFTDSERATITKYNADGDPTPGEGSGTVFVLPTTRGDETTLPQTSPLSMGDNQQVGLSASADPREWMIPLFNPGDPGDDANYA
jgi:hypothetical protein